jgi:MtN3 and saliva related transmembrane protein
MHFQVIDILGYTGGACMTINMIPQLYKTYTTKSVNDISVMFLVLNLIGLGLYIIYGIIKNIYTISIPVSISFIISCMLSILKYLYSNKTDINNDKFINNQTDTNNKTNYKTII